MQPVSSDSEQQWLVKTTWQFAGSVNTWHPVVFDSIQFLQVSKEDNTHWEESIEAYYTGSRLLITTPAYFYVRTKAAFPDTLITAFTPYTVSGSQTDTFLLYNNGNNLGVLQQLTTGNIGLQQDSLIHK